MKKEIEEIKERNRRVESDKSWETSWTRRGILATLTYIVVVIFLFSIDAPYPFLNALIPPIGYLIQQWTLPFAKKWWIEKMYGKNKKK